MLSFTACNNTDEAAPLPGILHDVKITSPRDFYFSIETAISNCDAEKRGELADSIYNIAKRKQWIPITFSDTAVFLYKGSSASQSIKVYGDLNGWSDTQAPQITLASIDSTKLYSAIYKAPCDSARLDYKLVVGSSWILDPGNPRRAYGGFGANSELAMPAYKYSPWVNASSSGNKGTLSANKIMRSNTLGYNVQYKIYLPYGYNAQQTYPLVIITDGQEYADSQLGAVNIVTDNLLNAGKIKPVIIAFVDPRDPQNLNTNRRMTELGCNNSYANFLANELYDSIRSQHSVSVNANEHLIWGTSMGGLNAAFCAITHPDRFGLSAIQSPAFAQANRSIFTLYNGTAKQNVKFYMDAGTVYDTQGVALEMKAIWDTKGYAYVYAEYPEAHSWGSWRARIDDILIYFFGK